MRHPSRKSSLTTARRESHRQILALSDALLKLQRTMLNTTDTGGEIMRTCYAMPVSGLVYLGNDPNGIRTRVTAVKGRCPGPLDDRVRKPGNIGIAIVRRKANWQLILALRRRCAQCFGRRL